MTADSAKVRRIVILSTCWIVYAYFPLHFHLFDAARLGYAPFWDEVLYHALAGFGYATFGCWLYTLTGRVSAGNMADRLAGRFVRMRAATLWSAAFFIFIFILLFDYS